ncbi:MAG: hypothetical protein KKH45_03125 [Proteobacteria bacterium]|nr:hypothetical protein [Pseudomonadota bacterium]
MYLQKIKNTLFYKYCSIISSVLFIILSFILPDSAHATHAKKRIHSIFFEDTDYELNVYRIYGKEPGNTLLLIGGIQGNEPGGFLSADHYADISLAKGNLIVVPRANFQSIVLNRRKINEDMNRKFADDYKSNYETKIVTILKKLMAESNCLLNLHDGSGFFSEKWEGPDRNPKKYGQSIIADCESYVNPETGKVLKLGDMARSVCEQINKHIENPQYRFRFNNHKTVEKSSPHKEQRKSATFYALYTCGIPAFGIETNKLLQLELKVRHHNLAINAFMELFGIVPETPGINLDDPELKYLIISVNNALPIAVKNQQTLYVNSGDSVTVSHIESNYERGLSADIIDYGTINDIRKEIKIKGPTRIIVRKDYYPCGSVYLALNDSRDGSSQEISVSDAPAVSSSFLSYKVKINNNEQICQNYDRLKLIIGDTFEIVDVITGMGDPSDMVVNLKGYVGNKQNNTGEDRGYIVNTAEDLWKRYSMDKKGRTYQVVVTCEDKTVGKLFIDLEQPDSNN